MTNRETVAVADLRPDDLILPECHMVTGYAYGMGRYTVVPMYRSGKTDHKIEFHWAFDYSEIEVDILRD